MLKVPEELLKYEGKPLFVVRSDGSIKYCNKHGRRMMQKMHHNCRIYSFYEIYPDFNMQFEENYVRQSYYYRKLKINVDVFKAICENGKIVYICIFDHILFNEEVDNLFNSMENIINIINPDGAIELINNAVYDITGLTMEDTDLGHSMLDHYFQKTTLMNEPAFFRALREKKQTIRRTSYKTGIKLLSKATPLLDADGNVKRILVISQNATEVSAMDEMLLLDESKQLEAPTIIHFNELASFFSSENYLVFSDEMKKVVNTAIKAAGSDSSVFIWGESGVGKEMIAKIIHYSSKRKDKPFITINCAAIPAELIESELFGYEKGAFTGAADTGKKGLLEEANGGTVFLDEIGEMSYAVQSKLLRAIQEKKVRRVGGSKDIALDVRYVSATNLTVEQFMDNSILRSDLYYRLSVIPINILPLRKRKEDIIPLVRHFMNMYNQQQEKSTVLSKRAMHTLLNYNWPGNVRELKNTIERSVIMADNDLIDDVSIINYTDRNMGVNNPDAAQSVMVFETVPLSEAYDDVFNQLVKKVYAETGSILQTAKVLKIDPSTIHRKIKAGKLNLQD